MKSYFYSQQCQSGNAAYLLRYSPTNFVPHKISVKTIQRNHHDRKVNSNRNREYNEVNSLCLLGREGYNMVLTLSPNEINDQVLEIKFLIDSCLATTCGGNKIERKQYLHCIHYKTRCIKGDLYMWKSDNEQKQHEFQAWNFI